MVPSMATPQWLREVAKTFKANTAMAADGFHMSHYALLSDEALQALAALFAIADATGLLPRQIARIVCPMLPKKSGGCRLIGLYPSYYRLWAKSWGPVIAKWEADIEVPWMAAVRGQSPTSLVYRTAVEAEHAAARGLVVGAVCMDISQFYEHIDHTVLVGRAMALGYPVVPLRGAVRSYRLARYIASGCSVARPVATEKGVVAGDSFATSLVKAYYKAPFETMIFRWSMQKCAAAFDAYLDDITLATSKPSAVAVADELIECAGDVVEVIEQELGARVAAAKTQVVSNNLLVTRHVSRALGVLGPVRTSDPFVLLGVDLVMANRWRPRARRSQQAGRLSAAARRRRRAAVFRRLAASKAAVLYKSGIRSVAAHGMECTGVADRPLNRLRTMAKDFLCPTRCSLSATLLLDPDPTLECSVAAAVRWAKEAWQATIDPRCLSLPRMRQIFEDMSARGVGNSWSASRGPVSAASLELCRLGWSWPSAFCFVDDLGGEWVLTSTSPTMLLKVMKESRGRQLAKILANKVGGLHPVDPSPILKVLASGKLLDSERQRVCLRRTFQGAVVTNTRLRAMGYDVDGTCPLCGLGGDRLKHRVLFCRSPLVSAVRAECLPADVAEAAADMQEHELAGWTHTDAVAWPGPADGDLCSLARFEVYDVGLDVWVATDIKVVQQACTHDEAKLFTDGSLVNDLWPSAARAGWGFVVGTPSRPLVRAYGPVPGQVQTVPAAEWAAVEIAARFWPGHRTPPVGYCLHVVRSLAEPAKTLKLASMYAGTLRRAMAAAIKIGSRLFGMSKVKSHQVSDPDMPSELQHDIFGNNLADAAAKLGACCHPQGSAGERRLGLHSFEVRTRLAVAVAKIISVYPVVAEQFGGRLSRGVPPRGRARPQEVVDPQQQHSFANFQGSLLCQRCFRRVDTWASAERVARKEVCPGAPQALALAMTAGDRGHSIRLIVWKGLAGVVCTSCGAHATHRCKLLASQCRPAARSSGRSWVLTRLAAGLHPDKRKDGPLEAQWQVLPGGVFQPIG